MKILFLDPATNVSTDTGGAMQGNIGLEYIAAVSQEAGHDVKILQPSLNEISYAEIIKAVRDFDVVAISCMTWNAEQAVNLAQKIKALYPSMKLAVGGIGPTGMPEYFSPYFDVVVVGEGEKVFLDWLSGKRKERIIYAERDLKWNGKIRQLRDQEVIRNSQMRDIWPVPHADYLASNIIHGKGCYNNCYFCCSPLIWKQKITWRDPSEVANELISLADQGVNSIDFLDSTFNADTQRVTALCKSLIRSGVHKRVKWAALMDPSQKNAQELMPLMKEAGCIKVAFGIEDPTSRMRKIFTKSSADVDLCYQTCESAEKLNLIIRAFFIVGDPKQDSNNTRAMKEALLSWPINEVRISIFVPFPGTGAWKKYKDRIIEPDFSKWNTTHPIISSPHFNSEEIAKLRRDLTQLFYQSENYRRSKAKKIAADPAFQIAYEQFEKNQLILKGYKL